MTSSARATARLCLAAAAISLAGVVWAGPATATSLDLDDVLPAGTELPVEVSVDLPFDVTDIVGPLEDVSGGFGSGSAAGPAALASSVPISSPRALAALSIAGTQVGKPYEWGATGPIAYDCSGLVQWAFRQVGVSLPRTTYQQARAGSPVPISALSPGDVVVLNRDGSHVGIYAGEGMVLNAYDRGFPVGLTPLNRFAIFAVRRFY
ncbi:C40 family peptidase [Nocardia sp. alder85J]|uniref:C40 family peptidase n=1 Tax=Nocardia sp. alder85J TaxID=2862949 RepID=UPI001CD5BD72|nr:NlpC/P60 family protein [Nocardia sp. alder85J]MCX4095226.1 NlpC/P60 family protein [Nocardia sp. alder85J]